MPMPEQTSEPLGYIIENNILSKNAFFYFKIVFVFISLPLEFRINTSNVLILSAVILVFLLYLMVAKISKEANNEKIVFIS
jgi:hypothetical protein